MNNFILVLRRVCAGLAVAACLSGCGLFFGKSYCVELKSGERVYLHQITKITNDSTYYWFYDGDDLVGGIDFDIVEKIELLPNRIEKEFTVKK